MIDDRPRGRLERADTRRNSPNAARPTYVPGPSSASVRVHMDIVVSSQMLVDRPPGGPGGTVVLLPVQTRYEMQGGVTRPRPSAVLFTAPRSGPPGGRGSPGVGGVHGDRSTARPEMAALVHFSGTAGIREEISRLVPNYALMRTLEAEGDQFQYGGPMLCGLEFPRRTAGPISALLPCPAGHPDGAFLLRPGAGASSTEWSKATATAIPRRPGGCAHKRAGRPRPRRPGRHPVLLRSESGQMAGRARVPP